VVSAAIGPVILDVETLFRGIHAIGVRELCSWSSERGEKIVGGEALVSHVK
jgi:hypothetical protein